MPTPKETVPEALVRQGKDILDLIRQLKDLRVVEKQGKQGSSHDEQVNIVTEDFIRKVRRYYLIKNDHEEMKAFPASRNINAFFESFNYPLYTAERLSKEFRADVALGYRDMVGEATITGSGLFAPTGMDSQRDIGMFATRLSLAFLNGVLPGGSILDEAINWFAFELYPWRDIFNFEHRGKLAMLIHRDQRISKELLLKLCYHEDLNIASSAAGNKQCPIQGQVAVALLGEGGRIIDYPLDHIGNISIFDRATFY